MATVSNKFVAKNGLSANGDSDITGTLTTTSTIIAPAPQTLAASLRLPPGTAPVSLTNGDLWTTSAGLYVRANGATQGPLLSASTADTGLSSLSSVTVLNNRTDTQTVFIATGATTNGSTKTINLGTGGVSGSTTSLTIFASGSGRTQNMSVYGGITIWDTLGSTSVVLTQAGAATFSGKVTTPASTTSATSLNIPHGTEPSAPNNGDVWTTTNGAYTRISSVTKSLTEIAIPFYQAGTLTTGTGKARFYIEKTSRVVSVRASCSTAPTGDSVIVDVNKNGTTIFTTQGNRPTIAASGNTSGSVTNMDVTSLAAGDYITIDIDQIGSTAAGADLTVTVWVE